MFYEYLAIHPQGQRSQLPSLNLAVRRSAFQTVGGFDERYPRPSGEDADLTLRLIKAGFTLYFEPRAIVRHSPHRNIWRDVWRHGYYQGMYSTKVDRRYAGQEGYPPFLRSPAVLVLAAPLLAAAVTVRMFYRYPALRTYWKASPGIYLAKIAWCLGAASSPFR
jgi:GT2 family glycosyltransferase